MSMTLGGGAVDVMGGLCLRSFGDSCSQHSEETSRVNHSHRQGNSLNLGT